MYDNFVGVLDTLHKMLLSPTHNKIYTGVVVAINNILEKFKLNQMHHLDAIMFTEIYTEYAYEHTHTSINRRKNI